MSRARFEELVTAAMDDVPAELSALVDNCVVLVEDDPPADDPDLLGVYDGTPAVRPSVSAASTPALRARRARGREWWDTRLVPLVGATGGDRRDVGGTSLGRGRRASGAPPRNETGVM